MITINPTKTAEVKAAACKAQAKQLLVETDFAELASVRAAITNAAQFDTYRAAVRDLFLNPVAEPVWPERPEAVWSAP